jgi:serine phosphatase RsbU (regulator of sigma subunit)
MLVTLGSRCAGALERASLYERDRNVALTLQNRLLSVLPPTPPWLEAAARYVPATNIDIGGDWFQVLDAGEGRIAAIVGDAVGHGLASAAAMGQLRASIMTAVANDPRPGRVLSAADLFARRGADTLGATVGCVLLGPAERISYACAGLPPPVWLRAAGDATLLTGARRPLLGIGEAGIDYEEASIEFDIGDTLVLYTDGLIERRGEPIDVGIERLRQVIQARRGLRPEDLCDAVLAEVALEQPEDDIALLVMQRCPSE